ncbi:MAG TPA: hypothetical protein VJ111_09660 [Chitinophagaceae bacterium]|nr:hypothetical protein [Chitinophagaceae bacterium]
MRSLLLFLLLPSGLFAQDITGIWTGFVNTSGASLPYELAISETTKNRLTGYSLTIFTFDGVENVGVKSMKIKKRKGSISIEDDVLVYNNYKIPAKRVVLVGTLSLTTGNSMMVLDGTFITRSIDRSSFKGTIRLEKKDTSFPTKLIPKLDELNLTGTLSFMHPEIIKKEEEKTSVAVVTKEALPVFKSAGKEKQEAAVSKPAKNKRSKIATAPQQKKKSETISIPPAATSTPLSIPAIAASDIASRKIEIIRNVLFKSDSLVLSLYDNGEVDGDTVSIVLNDKVIIAKKRLSTSVIKTTIYTSNDPADSLKLIMYAENLGTIPPNTGLLIIQDGDDRHEIRFEGDLQKNSAVILRRKR